MTNFSKKTISVGNKLHGKVFINKNIWLSEEFEVRDLIFFVSCDKKWQNNDNIQPGK